MNSFAAVDAPQSVRTTTHTLGSGRAAKDGGSPAPSRLVDVADQPGAGRSALQIATAIRMPYDVVEHVLKLEQRRGHVECEDGYWFATEKLKQRHGRALGQLTPINFNLEEVTR